MRKLLIALLALLIATALVACGDDEESAGTGGGEAAEQPAEQPAEQSAEEIPTVRMQALSSGLSPLILKAIETEKLDEKHGFKGEFKYLEPDAAAQSFLQGESDVSFETDSFTAAIAVNGGQDVTGVQPLLNNNASIIVRDDSPYESPEDLVGKRVGHFGVDSGTTSVMAALLGRDFDINVLEDFELVEAAPPALVELLANGDVEAIFDFTPHTERAITEANGRVLYLAADQDQEGAVPGLAYVTATDEWLEQNRETAEKVVEAAKEATALFVDSDYEVLREEPYAGLIDQSDATMDAIVERANEIPIMFEGTWDQAYADGINEFVSSMGERGILLDQPPDRPIVMPLDAFYDR